MDGVAPGVFLKVFADDMTMIVVHDRPVWKMAVNQSTTLLSLYHKVSLA